MPFDAESKITRKPRITAKYQYAYHSNVNVLIGEIKNRLPDLLRCDKNQIMTLINEIIDIGRKELVSTKIPVPTNKERDRTNFRNTNCPSNASMRF